MPKHRTKSEAHGLATATNRANAKPAVERTRKAAEKKAEELNHRVFKSTLLHMGFIADKCDKNGKAMRGKGRDWWHVKETGDFLLDHALGEKLATEFLRYGRQRGRRSILAAIIEGMIEKGPKHCRGVRMGFLSVISDQMPESYDFNPEIKQLVLLR